MVVGPTRILKYENMHGAKKNSIFYTLIDMVIDFCGS